MALPLLVPLLEVYEQHALYQILIHLDLRVLILRQHLQEHLRLYLYVGQLLGIRVHLCYLESISRKHSYPKECAQTLILEEVGLAVEIREALDIDEEVECLEGSENYLVDA